MKKHRRTRYTTHLTVFLIWWRQRDSNPRPLRCERRLLLTKTPIIRTLYDFYTCILLALFLKINKISAFFIFFQLFHKSSNKTKNTTIYFIKRVRYRIKFYKGVMFYDNWSRYWIFFYQNKRRNNF